MRWSHVKAELLDQARQAWRLALGQVEDEARQRGGVDDRMLERALQPPADQPRVERVMAVLDEDRSLGETEESPARVLEFRRPDEHRAVDVVALFGVRVDGCAAVDQRVEEGQGGASTAISSQGTGWAAPRGLR